MAIVRMKPFYLIGTLPCQLKVLKELQNANCVEIKKSENVGEHENNELKLTKLNNQLERVKICVEILKTFGDIKKNWFNFKIVEPVSKIDEILLETNSLQNKVDLIIECFEKLQNNSAMLSKLQTQKHELMPYLKFDYYLNGFETKFTKGFVVKFLGKLSEKKIKHLVKKPVYFEIVSQNKQFTTIFFVVMKNDYEQFKEKFSKLGFSELEFSFEPVTVKKRVDFLNCEIKKLENERLNLGLKLKQHSSLLKKMKMFYDILLLKVNQQKQLQKISTTQHTFLIEGYLNPQLENVFKKIAKKFNLFFKIFSPNENSPVKFCNGAFVSTVESVTQTYSMPSFYDTDPNPVMAIFYYAFFGIMFSDAGYGFVMALFCSFFAFSKKIDSVNRKKFKMFFCCGISTIICGVLFGSFFGDAVGVISKMFFNSNVVLPPLAIDPLKEPLLFLKISLLIGLIHILVGLLTKFCLLIKFKKFKDAFFNELCWFILLFGVGEIFVASFFNYGFLNFLGICTAVFGCGSILLLSSYKNKGLMKIFGGLINLYGLTSYVGDILSYCRLMALSIATGVVASVVNLLSTMFCGSFIGNLIFTIIFIFGHALNFGINALGAHVHTIRLQYVEFFSKFYDGGGKLFVPFGMNTKFCEFKQIQIK